MGNQNGGCCAGRGASDAAEKRRRHKEYLVRLARATQDHLGEDRGFLQPAFGDTSGGPLLGTSGGEPYGGAAGSGSVPYFEPTSHVARTSHRNPLNNVDNIVVNEGDPAGSRLAQIFADEHLTGVSDAETPEQLAAKELRIRNFCQNKVKKQDQGLKIILKSVAVAVDGKRRGGGSNELG